MWEAIVALVGLAAAVIGFLAKSRSPKTQTRRLMDEIHRTRSRRERLKHDKKRLSHHDMLRLERIRSVLRAKGYRGTKQ